MENLPETLVPDNNCSTLPISTLVFMDLESTGLPHTVGKRNVQITEISLIAVDRENFEADHTLRVLNKLSLCLRPRAIISYGAMEITGLYNDVLENQEKFDESVPKLFEYFFRRLRRPLCLLAHNGKKFDFPLLQAELNHINYSLDPAILCADTLEALRFVVPKKNEVTIPPPLPSSQENSQRQETAGNEQDATHNDDTEKLLSQDIEWFSQIEEPKENGNENKINVETSIKMNGYIIDERTPSKSKISNEYPPKIQQNKRKQDEMLSGSQNNYQSSAKRALFRNGVNYVKPKISFTLESLYRQFFDEDPPQSHYAEADCIALSKVCQKVNPEFLKWIDANSKSFNEIKAMW